MEEQGKAGGAIEALCRRWDDECTKRAQSSDPDALDRWMTAAILGEQAMDELSALRASHDRLLRLDGNDEHPENRCNRCGGRNLHNWFADSDRWNAYAGDFCVLCPMCFGELAREKGFECSAWRLSPSDDSDEAGRLLTRMHAAFDEIETTRASHERMREEVARLRKGVVAVEALIDESSGVDGLHLNGDLAPWSDLRTGGRYEGWLIDFDAALSPPAPGGEQDGPK